MCSVCAWAQLKTPCHLCDCHVCLYCDVSEHKRQFGQVACYMTDCRRVTCASCIVVCTECGCEVCKKCHEGICLGLHRPEIFILPHTFHVPRHEFRHKLNQLRSVDCNFHFQ